MIDKLELEIEYGSRYIDSTTGKEFYTILGMRPPGNRELMDKLNEIIDFLNKREEEGR